MEDHNLPLVKAQLKTNSKCVFKSTQMSLFFLSSCLCLGGQSKPHLKAARGDHMSQNTEEQTPHFQPLHLPPTEQNQAQTTHYGETWG